MSAYFKVFSTIAKKLKGNKSKVGPTIKSVKPNLKKTVAQTKSDEYVKRIRELDSAEKKIKSGKEMMKEGQKARKKMIDTKRAFQFKHGKSTHAIKPGDKPEVKYKGNIREQKMGGGMMGRRMGYSQGSKKGKIPTTPKEKSLAKLAPPKDRITFGDVVAGRTKGKRMQARNGTKFGATRPKPNENLDPNNLINIRKKKIKQKAKEDMK